MRFKQYLIEDVIDKAKEIIKQKKEDEEKFEASLNKIDISKLGRRIKFSSKEFGKDEMLQKIILTAIDVYENILKIPKSTKYKLVMVPSTKSTGAGGEGEVYVNGNNVEMQMVRSLFGLGRTARAYFTILEVLAHEMIHVEQHLVKKQKRKKEDWDLPWAKRPWEIEAKKRENEVFKKFLIRADKIYLGKNIKIENGKIWKLSKGKKTDFEFEKHFKQLAKEVPNLSFGDLDYLEFEMVWKEL